MKRVHQAADSIEAHELKIQLENAGFQVAIVGDRLQPLFGGLPVSYPEIWVNADADLERVRAVIRHFEQLRRRRPKKLGVRLCPNCGEQLTANFDECWKCAASEAPIQSSDEAESNLTGVEPMVPRRRRHWLAALIVIGVAGVAVFLVLWPGNQRFSPLFKAAHRGAAADVEKSLAFGYPPDPRDSLGQTPLHYTANAGAKTIHDGAISLGGGVHSGLSSKSPGSSPDPDKEQFAGFAEEYVRQRVQVAELLLAHGAGVDVRDSASRTPLHWAAATGNYGVAEVLLSHGAEVNAVDNRGRTPASWAAINGHPKTCAVLLKYKADLSLRDEDGRTPLLEALARGRGHTALLLLQAGADPNAAGHGGTSPLHLAAANNLLEAAAALIERKADVNAVDAEKYTALMFAARYGYTDMLELLLGAGADVFARNIKGETALDCALRHPYPAAAELLQKAGAVPHHE